MADWLQCYSGAAFYPLDPKPEDIHILDIGHALSLICRFGGHVKRFYSVAEHSVLVSKMVPDQWRLRALLHDAAEAYIGDMIRPLKRDMPEYQEAEDRIWEAICQRFGLGDPIYPEADKIIKHADNCALRMEAEALMMVFPQWAEDLPVGFPEGGMAPRGMPPAVAGDFFTGHYFEYGGINV